MSVSFKSALRNSKAFNTVTGNVPFDQGFVAGSRDEHIRGFDGSCKGGDPSTVTAEFSSEGKVFGGCVHLKIHDGL